MKKEIAAIGCCLLSAASMAQPVVAEEGFFATVSGTAAVTVPNDEAYVTFVCENENKDAAAAMNEVVARGNAAQKKLRKFSGNIIVEETDVTSWPVYTRAKEGEVPEIGAWGAKETIRVTVKDVTDVSKVMEAVGQEMRYEGVRYSVSKETEKARNAEMLKAAIQDALAQAQVVAEGVGLDGAKVRIEKVYTGERPSSRGRYYSAPNLAADRTGAAPVAPELTAGTSELTAQVKIDVRISH